MKKTGTKVNYSRIENFILFGGGLTLINLAEAITRKHYTVYVYTSPRHAEEILDSTGESFEAHLKKRQIAYEITSNVNTCRSLLDNMNETTLGIGFGEAWSFSKPILNAFEPYRLIDFMGIPLPRYRGGAHYTWMIQNEERASGFAMQLINEDTKQGEFDSGEILFSEPYQFPADCKTPADYFASALTAEMDFLLTFLDRVIKGDDFELSQLDERQSLFLPRLHTKLHGWVNWSWSGEEIERFINSFDEPYPGAQTYIGDRIVHLKGCSLIKSEGKFHPYQSGIVTRIDDDKRLYIITNSGLLTIKRCVDQRGHPLNPLVDIKSGDRLFTPSTILDKSIVQRISYQPDGTVESHKTINSFPVPATERNKTSNQTLKNAPSQQLPTLESLVGDKVIIRSIALSDCNEQYLAWLNNKNINQYLETRWMEQSIDTITAFVKSMQVADDQLLMAIIEKSSNKHIGNIKLGPINFNHRHGEISYFIGETQCWGLGYATEAISLVTQFAFENCDLEYLSAGLYENNIGSLKALKKSGYEQHGCFKKHLMGTNGREDHLFYGMDISAYWIQKQAKQPLCGDSN